MTFISYAQNYEDVMLWRALKHVEKGFYIDLGAWSPDSDSVTRAFYEAGWRGINVEPLQNMHAALQARRPHDINLAMAVSNIPGQLEFHNICDTGLSTLNKNNTEHVADLFGVASVSVVDVVTLANIWQKYVPLGQDVHFLKIDVEGLEEKVIRGADWQNNRPWIVVVESTEPQSPEPNHQDWDPLLITAGYQFVWFDGLNRYYIAKERGHLAKEFNAPPNVFDNFRRIEEIEFEKRAIEAEATLHLAEANKSSLEVLLAEMQSEFSGQIKSLQVTFINELAPLRYLRDQAERSKWPFWYKLILRPSGKPSRLVRRMFFHTNGRPRGVFKKWVLYKDGRPRKVFRIWMTSPEYQSLRGAVSLQKLDKGPLDKPSALSSDAEIIAHRISRLRSSKGK